ncbi:MAG: hypothetical protein CR997_02165 [Acidobacteria bacterium]|nr:MAG: hypothetical protein CR997_02165 [Acidobacteriota bacterium]
MHNQRFYERLTDTPICVYLCSSVVPFFYHRWTQMDTDLFSQKQKCLHGQFVGNHEWTRMNTNDSHGIVLFPFRLECHVKNSGREE